jgi:hypothetical protein
MHRGGIFYSLIGISTLTFIASDDQPLPHTERIFLSGVIDKSRQRVGEQFKVSTALFLSQVTLMSEALNA